MIKYLLCILSLVFLLIGGSLSTHKEDVRGFRETTVISLENDAVTATTFTSTPAESHSLGILTTFSLPRNITPVRTLKFNDIPVIVQLLSSRSFRLPEDKRKILLSDTNYLKYSNRYYIYTLAHILI
ncbi:hypothetical protein [Bacteroides congonensis]|uniref:hypothetical protein n=1 Tax=Bacteroides congonensis TaxID=1871006 RepID=UPI001E4DD47A|nr:hypothetical protein [Bacteroides congonensis]